MNYIDTSHLRSVERWTDMGGEAARDDQRNGDVTPVSREDIEAQLAAHFEADLCNVEVTADRAAGVVAFAHPAAVAKQFGLDPRG